jgi:hypothetical protein
MGVKSELAIEVSIELGLTMETFGKMCFLFNKILI